MRVTLSDDVEAQLQAQFSNKVALHGFVNECLRLFLKNGLPIQDSAYPTLPVTAHQLDRRCDELAGTLNWLQNEFRTLQNNHNFLCTLFFEHLKEQLGEPRFNEIIDRANERLRSGDNKTQAAAE